MTGLHRARNTMIERIAVAVFAAVVAAGACGWSDIKRDVFRPVEGFPDTVDAWVYMSYATPVDCSPPRACYANTQWFHAYVNCNTRLLAMIQRIPMDLNGDPVAVVDFEEYSFKPPRDAGEEQLLGRLCGDVWKRDDDEPTWHIPRRRQVK